MMMLVVLFKFIVILFLISHLSKAQDSSSSDNPVNNCYTFHDVDSTWEEARDACLDMGAHLVTLETTEKWNKLKSFIAEKVKKSGTGSYTHWYIGLRKESGTWKWTEAGSPGVVVAEHDSRWQPSEPSTNDPVEETCGEINSFIRNVHGHFNNVRCDLRYQAEITTEAGTPAAPRGYICENY